MVLIVTNRADLTADWGIVELRRRGVPFVRFNTEDFPQNVRLSWSSAGAARMSADRSEINLSEVTAVWYRRPVPPVLSPDLSADQARWAAAEARESLEGVWRTLDARWVNHPDRGGPAASKPAQLRAARRLGFAVPDTLMTNDPEAAQTFVAAQVAGAIVKPVRSGRIAIGGEEQLFFTSKLALDSVPPFERLGREPYLFQAFVEKRADIRVTVIGDEAFAVRIHSQEGDETRTDFRKVDAALLRHEPFDLPRDVHDRCVAFVHDCGCLFGAIDLAELFDGSFVFFENNPGGQWAWIEQMTGLPLRSRLVDLLTGV